MGKITKKEFIKNYALRSGVSGIKSYGIELEHSKLVAIPCDCEYESCEGWQMKEIME